ncbi:MAG: YraN family protein [Pseudomonadota bacterium]|nr:MAG: YraN family protein [Pseudomonadota bacterium]
MLRARPPHLRQGEAAEATACQHLKQQGMTVVARNYRSPHGEIDLIMQEDQTLVFVEVRYRRSLGFGHPAETIDARKQQRLRATAEHYLQRQPRGSKQACRFDIVAVSADGDTTRVEWVANAF